MPSSLLQDLNPDQQKAVTHTGGPLLILAGAGSGKTRALTYRAAYLIKEKNIPPERILLTTFTNKAAGEMQQRLQQLVGYKLPFAGTFHSLSARFLRRHGPEIGLDRDFLIYDTNDSLDAIKIAMRKLNLDPKEIRPRGIFGAIEAAKHELISPADYAGIARGPFQREVAKVFIHYQKLLQNYHALDFNDLLLFFVKLFQNSPSTAQKYQDQFLHILVDEYQDTNKVQYLITQLLSRKHQNVCVVGDASQAIYSWRGADYRNLIALGKDFPALTTIKLEQNYRSTQNILKAADAVIGHNTLHPILNLWTDSVEGDPVVVYRAQSEYDEVNHILKHLDAVPSLADTAVLYRTNAQSRVIEEVFVKKGIPYVLVGGTKFYDRKEVKDVLAYLRYAYNHSDQVSYDRLQKLGKRRFERFQTWLEKTDLSTPPLDLLDAILQVTDYLSRYQPKDPEDAARIENVKELRSVAQNFSTLTDFLENVALVEQETHSQGPKVPVPGQKPASEAVYLMTLHASKGLEFKQVFILGMEEGLFPHSRSLLSKEDIEEERRLCYVGLTRAQKKLFLSYADSRLYFGSRARNQISRFIGELPEIGINHQSSPSLFDREPTAPLTHPSSKLDDELLDKFFNDEIDIDTLLDI